MQYTIIIQYNTNLYEVIIPRPHWLVTHFDNVLVISIGGDPSTGAETRWHLFDVSVRVI